MREKLEMIAGNIPDVKVISAEEALEFSQNYGSNQLTIFDDRYLKYILGKIAYEKLISSNGGAVNRNFSFKDHGLGKI